MMLSNKRIKKRKTGFTLIEVLSVIVLIFIVSAILVPLLYNLIRSAREAAFIDSVYGIIDAAEYKYIKPYLDKTTIKQMVFNYPDDKDSIAVTGKTPDYGQVSLQTNGRIAVALWSDSLEKCAVKDYNESVVRFDEYIEVKEDCFLPGEKEIAEREIINGWIRLTLYYPSNSTERMWRLGSEGEIRTDSTLMWQEYTGPIYVPITRVEDVWIKYKVNNKTFVIPPLGRVLVDIEPDSYKGLVEKVKVKINYDADAKKKEYRVGNSAWKDYDGEFYVTENVMIEARAEKDDNVYDDDGNLLMERTAVGRDYVYIGNIGVETVDLPAPTIERLEPTDDNEVARIKITYPVGAHKKIYKLNYGLEENYHDEVSVTEYGTYLMAYYYDANGNRSRTSGIYINQASSDPDSSEKYEEPSEVVINPPLTDPKEIPVTPTYIIPGPTIILNPTTVSSAVQVSISAPLNAENIYIKLGNGSYKLYTNPIVVTEKNFSFGLLYYLCWRTFRYFL